MAPRLRVTLIAVLAILQRFLSVQSFSSLFQAESKNPFLPPSAAIWRRRLSRSTPILTSRSETNAVEDSAGSDTAALKQELLHRITDFQMAQAQYGAPSIDFGVKGGELNATSRAPQKVDYYAVSHQVGQAADAVMDICDRLAARNPTNESTKYWGDRDRGSDCPLDGPWKLLFTTAADASFSKNSTRGAAQAQNVVDAARGIITNVIDFDDLDDGRTPLLKQLNVVIRATAEGPSRVGLQFRYARAVLTRFFFLPLRWSLYIPVPAPFLTRWIVLVYRLFRRRTAVAPPKAYFDVLFLDDELRIHKTGEDNLFVQARPTWSAAQNYGPEVRLLMK